MRISKKERERNAINFYQLFMNGSCCKAAIVVKRTKSSNPNISRCQFLTVPGTFAFMGKPIVIAESISGIEGCFTEMLRFINPCVQKTFFEEGFNEWLLETFNFEITYKDGLVFMLERRANE